MSRSNKTNRKKQHPLAGIFGGLVGGAEKEIQNRPKKIEQAISGQSKKKKKKKKAGNK